eukprot:2931238-Amphidinium_carterae.1
MQVAEGVEFEILESDDPEQTEIVNDAEEPLCQDDVFAQRTPPVNTTPRIHPGQKLPLRSNSS